MSSRFPYLTALIPSDALFWLSGDQRDIADGDDVDLLRDEKGIYDAVPAGSQPFWRKLATGENWIDFLGTSLPMQSSGSLPSVNLKHLFIVAAFDLAAFDNSNGLFSMQSSVNGILNGDNGTTKFFDFGFPSIEYRKSGTLYAANNMQAPMNGVPELIELKYPTGFTITDLQIGRDRGFSARLWNGRFDFAIGFNRALSTLELEKIRLYANLRSRIWVALGQTLTFPAPNIIFDGVNTAYATTYSRFYMEPLNYDSVTHSHTYEDETKTFNQTVTVPPRRWQIEFNGISAEKAQVLEVFWDNVRKVKTFNFYDYKRDETHAGVRVDSFSREHSAHESWKNNVRFNLVKY